MNKKYAAIVTDVQGCFTTWTNGALAVPGSDEAYVKSVESAARRLKKEGFLMVATQDWHPPNHISFAATHSGKKVFDTIDIGGKSQVLWPVHCVQGTEDARLLLESNLFDAIIRKAQNPHVDSYSAVKDDSGVETGLERILQENGITSIVIFGIATDYCVKATAIDLARAGFQVIAVEKLCRGVTPETSAQALAEMRKEGVKLIEELDLEKMRSLL